MTNQLSLSRVAALAFFSLVTGVCAETFSIAAVADVQYADAEPRGHREPREALKRLEHAVNSWNKRKLDWAVSLGDNIDWDDIDYSKFPQQTLSTGPAEWKHTKQVLAVWNKLKFDKHMVLGNHDYYVPYKDADGLSKPASVLRAFGYQDKAYYHFGHKGYRFVILDGDVSPYNFDVETPEYKVAKAYYDTFKGKQKTPWNAAISNKQLVWLAGVLDQALKDREPVVLMCHYPIHQPIGGHHLFNAEQVVALLDTYPNVVMWLHGHTHKGGYVQMGKRHHLNLKGMQEEDDSWYQIDFSPEIIKVYQAENLETPVYELKVSWPVSKEASK